MKIQEFNHNETGGGPLSNSNDRLSAYQHKAGILTLIWNRPNSESYVQYMECSTEEADSHLQALEQNGYHPLK